MKCKAHESLETGATLSVVRISRLSCNEAIRRFLRLSLPYQPDQYVAVEDHILQIKLLLMPVLMDEGCL